MKIRSIVSYTSTLVALAGTPFLAQQIQAAPSPMLGQVNLQFGNHGDRQREDQQNQSDLSDDQKRQLRQVYYRLEHARGDYEGHRSNAVREIQRAADEMGMDLQGSGYSQESQGSQDYGGYSRESDSQESSDNTLRHSQDRLRDIANDTSDPVRHHLYNAIHELDEALQVR